MLVVGPSGVGKDAVIQEVRVRLQGDENFVFPRRIVTRAANAAEDHTTLTPAEFETQTQHGAFALHWQAHGLHYGIPVEIDTAVRSGKSVVFNTSRRLAQTARARYTNVAVVLIDAPLQLRAERLAMRNRERPEDVAARLERTVPDFDAADADVIISNTDTLNDAVDRLIVWLTTSG